MAGNTYACSTYDYDTQVQTMIRLSNARCESHAMPDLMWPHSAQRSEAGARDTRRQRVDL